MRPGFIAVSFDDYVEKFLKSNPDEDRAEVIEGLHDALDAARQGARCQCGEPIWIIGSSVVGLACFTCITGEAVPDDDLEIPLDDPHAT